MAQKLNCDTINISINEISHNVLIGESSPDSVQKIFGKGRRKTKLVQLDKYSNHNSWQKIETIRYKKMNLTFDFETGFTSKTQVKKCTTKLKGIKAEEGCQIIFNNSINMDCSKEKIESIIDTSDNAKIHSEPEASVYWYLNHGLQVRYINNSSQSRIKWVYFYMSDPTLDKNIEIMAKWRKEN